MIAFVLVEEQELSVSPPSCRRGLSTFSSPLIGRLPHLLQECAHLTPVCDFLFSMIKIDHHVFIPCHEIRDPKRKNPTNSTQALPRSKAKASTDIHDQAFVGLADRDCSSNMDMGMSSGGGSSSVPLNSSGVDFSNATQAFDFLQDILDDSVFQITGNRYARYFWYGVVVVIGIAGIINVVETVTLKNRLVSGNKKGKLSID
jgi:hypothetical protein